MVHFMRKIKFKCCNSFIKLNWTVNRLLWTELIWRLNVGSVVSNRIGIIFSKTELYFSCGNLQCKWKSSIQQEIFIIHYLHFPCGYINLFYSHLWSEVIIVIMRFWSKIWLRTLHITRYIFCLNFNDSLILPFFNKPWYMEVKEF